MLHPITPNLLNTAELNRQLRNQRIAKNCETVATGLLVLFLMAAVATGLGLITRALVWLFFYGYNSF